MPAASAWRGADVTHGGSASDAAAPSTWDWLRWALVMPTAILSFYVAVLVAGVLFHIPERLCRPEDLESGSCVTAWAAIGHQAALAFGAAVGAALMVSAPAAIAPRWRSGVALLAFAGGFALVSRMTGFGAVDPVLFIAATSAGLAMLVLVHVRSLTP